MLSVDIEKIVPVTSARDMFNKIVDEVENSDILYVLTKNGKPAAVVVGVNHLEKLTGETSGEIMTKVDQAQTPDTPAATDDTAKPFELNPAAEETTPAPTPDSSPVTPPVDEPTATAASTPASDPFSAAPTDSFSAAPATPASSATTSSDFNAAPATPAATPAPDPMAPVTDGDAKNDLTGSSSSTFGGHNPAPGAAGNTNATPPAGN